MSRRKEMGAWPADEVKRRRVADLVPYARNARTHSEEQVAQIAASITTWGWTIPVLIDEAGGVIAGHGRLLAAEKLGIEDVPTMVARGWTEAQRRAYIIADNKLAMNADWDDELLRAELTELRDLEFDIPLVGFGDDELRDIFADVNLGLTDPDDLPDKTPPVARLGDVWTLGTHRLVCGDCTDADVVAKCLNGVEPHLLVTDPPYGVSYNADWRNRADRANGKPYGASAIGLVENDDRFDWSEAWALFPGEVAYVWHAAGRHASTVQQSLEASGFEIRCQVIWAKPRFAISRGHYHWQHEPCWYAVKKGGKGYWSGDRSQTTLWNIEHLKSETGHSTQKPVECMKRPIENNSAHGDAVYDPFVGSGTTIVAAEMTGRVCHAIELNPEYVDVVIARWQTFTGEKATRDRRHRRKAA